VTTLLCAGNGATIRKELDPAAEFRVREPASLECLALFGRSCSGYSMRRKQWVEIHDQHWFPNSLRNLVTDTLQFVWNFFDIYRPIVPRLRKALEAAGTHRVLDLCSGGGGPWLRLHRGFEEERFPVDICLTDKYPNAEAFEHTGTASETKIVYHADAVDATRVPAELRGFRTLFTSFHHFPPEAARAILQDAMDHQQGVGIFEVPKRDPLTILLVIFMPIMAFVLVPLIRPFRWSRLLWTYLIPVVPLVLWFDGIMSCMRAYSPSELHELTQGLSSDGYRWEIGEERRGMPVTITYLIGYPSATRRTQIEM
jgi:hypothetical protein